MSFRHLSRSGTYFRVADPAWANPIDGVPGSRGGGRWNRPDSFSVVYLNRTKSLARKYVVAKLRDEPYGPEDLDPLTGPTLVPVDIDEASYVDVVTNEGCTAAGFSSTYPDGPDGRRVPHEQCWPVGDEAWASGDSGIACRSATTGASLADEDLAWFQREQVLEPGESETFSEWFWGAP